GLAAGEDALTHRRGAAAKIGDQRTDVAVIAVELRQELALLDLAEPHAIATDRDIRDFPHIARPQHAPLHAHRFAAWRAHLAVDDDIRSEERRVGKTWRYRWSA